MMCCRHDRCAVSSVQGIHWSGLTMDVHLLVFAEGELIMKLWSGLQKMRATCRVLQQDRQGTLNTCTTISSACAHTTHVSSGQQKQQTLLYMCSVSLACLAVRPCMLHTLCTAATALSEGGEESCEDKVLIRHWSQSRGSSTGGLQTTYSRSVSDDVHRPLNMVLQQEACDGGGVWCMCL